MALGGVIYIVSDHLSEFSAKDGFASGGENEEDGFSFKAKFAELINQLPLDDIRAQSLSFSQKSLHRLRILLLKSDNHLMKLISKISEKEKTPPSDFWKDFSNGSQKVSQEQIPESEPEPETKINLVFKSDPETEKFFDIKPAVKKILKPKRQRK